MKKKLLGMMSLFMVFSFIGGQTAFADEAQLMDMVTQMQKQMADLQSTVMAQRNEIQALKTQGPAIQMASGGVEAPAMSEEEFKKAFDSNLKDKIGGADKWLKDLKFKGDFRMRYEAANNTRASTGTGPGTPDVNRFRFRLRYGFEKMFSDEFKVGFRLASGSTNDPSSTNQTLTGAFGNKTITIDEAYAIYNPKWALIGPISDVEIGVGKMANPLADVHSWVTWDGDITPEGLYEKATVRLLKTENLTTDLDLLATQFVINESDSTSGRDSEFFGFSAGLHNKITGENLKNPIDLRNYINYELTRDFANVAQAGVITGAPNMRNNSFSDRYNPGDFGILSFYHEVGWKIDPLPKFKVFFEHGANTQDHMNLDQQRYFYVAGAKLGSAKKKGEWELGYTYGYLQANSTVSLWADSDFGFTNRKGSVIKAGYALTDFLTLNAAAFYTQNVVDSITGGNGSPSAKQLYQLDLVWKF